MVYSVAETNFYSLIKTNYLITRAPTSVDKYPIQSKTIVNQLIKTLFSSLHWLTLYKRLSIRKEQLITNKNNSHHRMKMLIFLKRKYPFHLAQYPFVALVNPSVDSLHWLILPWRHNVLLNTKVNPYHIHLNATVNPLGCNIYSLH